MASQFSIRLSVSAADLIKSIQDVIDNEINKKDALKGNPINISVNQEKLIDNIKKAINATNKALTSEDNKAKIAVGIDGEYFIQSIANAIKGFNQQAENKPTVKLTADLDITTALKKLQDQLAKNNITSINVGSENVAKAAANAVVNDTSTTISKKSTTSEKAAETAAINALTTAIRNETQAHKELSSAAVDSANAEGRENTAVDNIVSSIKNKTQAEQEYVQITLDNYVQSLEKEKQQETAIKNVTNAINEENKAIAEGNELLKQRTSYTGSEQVMPISRYTTYGDAFKNTTYREDYDIENDKWVTVSNTVVENAEKMQKANAKVYDTLNKLSGKLDEIRAKYTGAIGDKGIDQTSEVFKRLETEGQNIANMFDKITESSGIARDKLISDAEAAIKKYDLMARQAQNEQYAATSLRTRPVSTVKEIEINNLDKIKSKAAETHIPVSLLADDFKRLTSELGKVNNKDDLVNYLNDLDMVKSKIEALTPKSKQIDKIRTGITADLSSLRDYKKLGTELIPNNGNAPSYIKEINKQMAELATRIDTAIDKNQRLRKSVKDTNTADTISRKYNEQEQLHQEITEIEKSTKALEKKAAMANRVYESLSKNYAAVNGTDKNNPVTDIAALNEMQKMYTSIENEIAKASKLDGEAAAQALTNINNRIDGLKRLVEAYKDYEYIGGKDINSLKSIAQSNVAKLGTDISGKGLLTGDLAVQFKELQSLSEKITDANSFARYKAKLDEVTASFKLAISQASQLEKVSNGIDTSLNKLGTASGLVNSSTFGRNFGDTAVNSLNLQITELVNKLNTLKTAMVSAKSPETIQENINSYGEVKERVTELSNAINQLNKFSGNNTGLNKLSTLLNQTVFKQNGTNQDVVNLNNILTDLKSKYREFLVEAAKDVSVEGLKKSAENFEKLKLDIDNTTNSAKKLKNELQQNRMNSAFIKQQSQLIASIDDYVRKNNRAMNVKNESTGNTYGVDFENLRQSAQSAADSGAIRQLADQTAVLQARIKSAGLEGSTFFSEMKDKALKFVKWIGMTLFITKSRMYFRKLFTTVYELDTALVDLKKTFKGTDEELNQFYYDSNKLAKQLGVTTKEIIEQGAAWSRLGYSSKESMETMAKMSSMFAAISPDMNTEQATNGLVSIMKAFDIDPNKVLDEVLSKVNIIGNTAATSNGEIVTMLQKSSSAMKEANNTLEETIALETAAVEVTRDASSVGNAFKTVSMRIRGYDEETEKYIGGIEELSGKIADLTKTANKPGGITLFTNASKTTYKSTYQLIKDISEIYDDLTDKQQAGLLEALADKRQGQIVAATINNFKAAEKALDNMANSVGNAEAEMDVIRESAEYLMNQFKETFTAIAQHAISQNDLKSLIKLGTSLLEIVDNIVQTFGAIPTVLTTIIGVWVAANKKFSSSGIFGLNPDGKMTFLGAKTGKGWFSEFTNNRTAIQAQKVEIREATGAIKDFHKAFQDGNMTAEQYNAALNHTNSTVREYVSSIREGTPEAQAYAAANAALGSQMQKTSIKARLAAAGVKVLNTTLAMIGTMAINLAINAIFTTISNAINSIKNNISKLKELKSEMESLKSEASSLNDKLSETKLKISELEKLPKLTFLEKEELKELKQYNDELERQRRIVENQTKADIAEANSVAQSTWHDMNTPSSADYTKWWNYLGILVPGVGNLISGITDISKTVQNNFFGDQKKQLDDYEKILKEIKQIETSDEYKKDSSKFDETIKGKQGKLTELESKIAASYGKWNEVLAGLDPTLDINKETINSLQSVIDKWDILSGKIETTFKGIYNAPRFATVKQYLDDLAKNGELTAEKFKELTEDEVEGIGRFKEALENVEGLTVDDIIESIIREVEKLDGNVTNTTDSIIDFTTTLEKLYEVLDDVISKQEKLADAFKQIQLGSALSAQEILELIKAMPDLAQYVKKTAEGYTITAEGIRAISKENQKQAKDDAEKDLEKIREQISLLEQRDELEKKRDALEKEMESSNGSIVAFKRWDNADIEYQKAVEACQGITDTLEELKSAEQAILVAQGVLDEVFDGFVSVDNYDDAKSKISDYNKDIQVLDKAIQSLNEGTSLSYDEMVEIVEIAPELQDFFTEMQDGYTISEDKIEEWRKKSFEARNEYIQGLIEQAKMELQAAEDAKLAAEVILNIQNKFGTAAEQLTAQIELEASEKRIKDILDIIEKYETLMGDIKSPDNGDSLSNELQNQIDYYKTILDAVSAVKDKYTEVLDNEIDALEESKDALKDANDERQRELDLIEARNNLENAKKRKVYVYTEGEGFKQVQDKAAVKEAKEKYRDVITDIQIAEIDKAIEEREKQKEALEQSVKDLLELEQNIQDSMAISQAMQALGLSDPSQLLNLPDDVKEGVINGLADATIQKDIEDNKENVEHIAVTLDDVLANLGSNKTMADLSPDILDNVRQAAYNNAVQDFVDTLKANTDNMVNNVSYNNSPTLNANFNIYDANDPQVVAETVHQELNVFLTEYYNAIK